MVMEIIKDDGICMNERERGGGGGERQTDRQTLTLPYDITRKRT